MCEANFDGFFFRQVHITTYIDTTLEHFISYLSSRQGSREKLLKETGKKFIAYHDIPLSWGSIFSSDAHIYKIISCLETSFDDVHTQVDRFWLERKYDLCFQKSNEIVIWELMGFDASLIGTFMFHNSRDSMKLLFDKYIILHENMSSIFFLERF